MLDGLERIYEKLLTWEDPRRKVYSKEEIIKAIEFIEAARRVTKLPIKAEEAPRRGGDPATLIASSEKARTVLGWKPKYTDMEEIIATAWKWHSTHPTGYQG